MVENHRLGQPYDNPEAEASYNTPKAEWLSHSGTFVSLEDARLEVAYYLDPYFTLGRRHSALRYRSPQ